MLYNMDVDVKDLTVCMYESTLSLAYKSVFCGFLSPYMA